MEARYLLAERQRLCRWADNLLSLTRHTPMSQLTRGGNLPCNEARRAERETKVGRSIRLWLDDSTKPTNHPREGPTGSSNAGVREREVASIAPGRPANDPSWPVRQVQ